MYICFRLAFYVNRKKSISNELTFPKEGNYEPYNTVKQVYNDITETDTDKAQEIKILPPFWIFLQKNIAIHTKKTRQSRVFSLKTIRLQSLLQDRT